MNEDEELESQDRIMSEGFGAALSITDAIVNPMTPERFRAMCEAHDLTYSCSDDSSCYDKGVQERQDIKKAATELGMAIAAPIWNEIVQQKIVREMAPAFMWTTE